MVRDFLENNKIKFVQQHTFENCRYKKVLPFDFYIEDLNVCIEYDGEQHYRPVRFNGVCIEKANKTFEIVKIRDDIKSKYCEDNNIQLIRIPYWDFDKIEEILTTKLKQ